MYETEEIVSIFSFQRIPLFAVMRSVGGRLVGFRLEALVFSGKTFQSHRSYTVVIGGCHNYNRILRLCTPTRSLYVYKAAVRFARENTCRDSWVRSIVRTSSEFIREYSRGSLRDSDNGELSPAGVRSKEQKRRRLEEQRKKTGKETAVRRRPHNSPQSARSLRRRVAERAHRP